MDHHDKTILVTGGTGHQGGAAARHLLADGWRVRALVRDLDAPKALELRRAGAELAVGDLRDRASIDAAVAGTYGVYSVQVNTEGPDVEQAEARNLADAAKAADVEHFVQSSVFGADRDAGMPWVVSKHHIEAYLADSGLAVTVWRPVTFMENYLRHREEIMAGRLQGPEPPDGVKQIIALDDIGKFVALAFRKPDEWIGKTTEIAGDRMSPNEVAGVFTAVLDLPVVYEQVAATGMPAPKPDTSGAPSREPIDIASLRRHVPDLKTLEEWLKATW